MATRQLKTFTEKGNHEVGNLNSLKIRTVTNGAKVEGADIDNFTVVELGHNAEGERTCKQLSDVTKKGYLIASVERRYLGEELVDFYNAVGEDARIVIFDEAIRFDSSAFSLNTGVTEIKNGQVAHFDPATKKYIISAPDAAHADFATAYNKFTVVSDEDDLEYTCGKATVRLEVQ
jgi:hypothetical protein